MNAKQKSQARAVILSVMDAVGHPMSATEIAKHPGGRRFSTRSIGQLMKGVDGVRYQRNSKKWERTEQHVVVKESHRVARVVPNGELTPLAYSISRQQWLVKIGDREVPFTFVP